MIFGALQNMDDVKKYDYFKSHITELGNIYTLIKGENKLIKGSILILIIVD